MLSILFWGTGKNAFNWIIHNKTIFYNIEDKKFVDRKKINKKSSFLGYDVIIPEDIYKYNYNYICILSTFELEIKEDIIKIYKIPNIKIISKNELANKIIKNVIIKNNYDLNNVKNDIVVNYFINNITEDDLPSTETLKNYYTYKLLRKKYYDFAVFCADKLMAQFSGKNCPKTKVKLSDCTKNHYEDDYKPFEKTEISSRGGGKIVWVCWLQGINDMPPIVSACFERIKKQMSEMKVILITENNYTFYVNFPESIIEKYNKNYITRTHFSDLLRLELLIKYGGIWIDATVFLINKIPDFIKNASLFVFLIQPKPTIDPRIASNWFIKAEPRNKILLLTRDLLYKYYSENYFIENYFIFHYFFRIATEIYSNEWKSLFNIKTNSFNLYDILFEKFDIVKWKFIKEVSFCQKLSYKFNIPKNIEDTFYEKLINDKLS